MHENNLKRKSIRVNYVQNLAYEVFALLTPLITTPYISRTLGAEGIGIYSFTQSIAQYFVIMGNLGISTYGQMQIASCNDDKEKLSIVFWELCILRFITMLISLLAYLIIVITNLKYRIEGLVFSVLIIAAMFDFSWVFRGLEDFSKVVVRNFFVKIFMLGMIFALIKGPEDVMKYILLIAFSSFLGNLIFLPAIKGDIVRIPIYKLKIRHHISNCFVYFIPSIATSVYTLLDKAMLGYLVDGTAENGYYEQAHRIEQLLIVMITSLNVIMRSRMTYLYSMGNIEEMKNRLKRSVRFIGFVSNAMCFGLVGISDTFVPFFLGKGFDKSIILMKIFATLLITVGFSNCINTHYLGPVGRQKNNNIVLLGGAVTNFLLNLIVIPKYGAVGAACSSAITEAFILIGYMFLARDFISLQDMLAWNWRYLLSGMLMLMVVRQLPLFFSSQWIFLLCQILCGGLLYFIVLGLMRDEFFYKLILEIIHYWRKN